MIPTPAGAGSPAPRRGRRRAAAAGSAAALAAAGGAVLVGGGAAHGASTLTVTSTADTSDPGTLRWAIGQANGDPGSTIDFATGVSGTISLTSDLPTITASTTIVGPGSGVLAVSGAGAYRSVFVNGVVTVSVSGLTLTNPDPDDVAATALDVRGGATFTGTDLVVSDTRVDGYGGAGPVRCDNSTVTLTASVLSGNSNRNPVGFVASLVACDTTVVDSAVSDNSGGGGSGFSANGGSMTLDRSTVSGNAVADGGNAGGAVYARFAAVSVLASTISGNTAIGPAAINDYASTVTVVNSTITGNVATGPSGKTIQVNRGSLSLTQTTVTGNTSTAFTIEGIQYAYGTQASLVTVGTVVAGNTAGVTEFYGTSDRMLWTSEASVLGPASAAITTDLGDNQLGVTDPGLGPLADNGGPTLTRAPLPGSVVLDAGPATPPVFPGSEWDQRGEPFVRVYGGGIDVGAVEDQPGPAAVLTYAGATEVPAGAGTVELAARVDPVDCRSGSLEFLVDGQPVATVAVDPATGLGSTTAAVPPAAAFTVEVRLVDSVCAADPVRVTITVADGAPAFTG